MGCFWSNEDYHRCKYCNREAVNELNDICQTCSVIIQRRSVVPQKIEPVHYIPQTPKPSVQLVNRPCFGKYKCKSCGRFWNSRLCWPDSYQVCKGCSEQVFPFSYRALHSSDLTNLNDSNIKEHPNELCQKCKRLGHYCGRRKV